MKISEKKHGHPVSWQVKKPLCREPIKIHQAKASMKSRRTFPNTPYHPLEFFEVFSEEMSFELTIESKTLWASLCLWFISPDLLDWSNWYCERHPRWCLPSCSLALQLLPAVSTPLPVLDSDRPSLHEFDFFFPFWWRSDSSSQFKMSLRNNALGKWHVLKIYHTFLFFPVAPLVSRLFCSSKTKPIKPLTSIYMVYPFLFLT